MTGLVASAALKGILGRLTSAWSWLTASATHILAAMLAVAVLFSLYERHDAAKWHKVADSTLAAQKAATQAQVAVNHEPAAKSVQIAEKSDVDSQSYYAAGRAAGLAYADAHRVRDDACQPSDPGLPGADRAAQVDDGPGATSSMVALSADDYALLTGNSLRLAQVHQDAEQLIAAGAASPETPAP